MIKIIIKCPVFHKDNLEEQHIGSLRTYHHGYLNSTLMWREEGSEARGLYLHTQSWPRTRNHPECWEYVISLNNNHILEKCSHILMQNMRGWYKEKA